MGYIINGARPHSLTIGGVDYTARLIDFQVSDASAFKNGLVTTSGTLLLASLNDSVSLADYDRDMFKRGEVVLVDVTYPDGTTSRHPRGYLYVISTSYIPETETIEVEIGCELSLRRMLDELGTLIEDINPTIILDPDRRTFEGLSAALAANGEFVYQTNTGTLQKETFFPANNGGPINIDYISFRQHTALQVNPLLATEALPDEILLQYQVPSDAPWSDQQDTVQTDTVESFYYIQHPGPIWVRVRPPEQILTWIYQTVTKKIEHPPIAAGTCGATVQPPPDMTTEQEVRGYTITCNSGYETKEAVEYIYVTSLETSESHYTGPGAQLGSTIRTLYAPAIEANTGYYSDAFAACYQNYAVVCNPNASCVLGGLNRVKISETITKYYYGEADELISTCQETYVNTLRAAKPENWRTGVVNGVPQNFKDNLAENEMYLDRAVKTKYTIEENTNVVTTETYSSQASRGVGINGTNLNAYHGILTRQISKSTTIAGKPIAPDTLNAPRTTVQDESVEIILRTSSFTGPSWSKKYVVKETAPVPFICSTENEQNLAVDRFERYISKFYQGDAKGVQIVESLRKTIANNWKPNKAFGFYDETDEWYASFRMNAASWSLTPGGSYVAIDGIWIHDNAGTPAIPDNLNGQTEPTIAPVEPVNETFVFSVNVNLTLKGTALFDELAPELSLANVTVGKTLVAWFDGVVSQQGGLIRPTSSGSLPISAGGKLTANTELIIDQDLFV